MPRLEDLLLETDEFEEKIRQKLKLQEVKSVEDLLSREDEICLDHAEWTLLFERIDAEFAAVPRSLLYECTMIESRSSDSLSTGHIMLDRLLGGAGVPTCTVTELIGRPATGKSQLSMYCAVSVVGTALRATPTIPLNAIYIDCSQSLQVDRLAAFCDHLGLPWTQVGAQIRCYRAFEVSELLELLERLTQSLHRAAHPFPAATILPEDRDDHNDAMGHHGADDLCFWAHTRLLIVDSLGPLLSTIIRIGPFGDALLNRVMAQLSFLATRYALAIVTVNYARPDPEGGPDIPGLGISWSYGSSNQIRLTSDLTDTSLSSDPPKRLLEVIKSSHKVSLPILRFDITEFGLTFYP